MMFSASRASGKPGEGGDWEPFFGAEMMSLELPLCFFPSRPLGFLVTVAVQPSCQAVVAGGQFGQPSLAEKSASLLAEVSIQPTT